jgi:membrane associated rhomboid family serine protease
MIPLRDTIRSRSYPLVTWILIGVNAFIFLFEVILPPVGREQLIRIFGLVPARLNLTHPTAWLSNPLVFLTLFTSMFLHGGWFHLISNMWTLFIFGDNVEDRMGAGRYLIFYLLGGLVANLMQAIVFPSSRVPAVGASGAIAAVLGAYFVLFPRARVVTLIPIFLFPWFVEISAFFYLGIWFISQLYSGLFALGMPGSANMGGIAWWAHIGGFVFGMVMVNLFARRRRSYWDYYSNYPW